jgi:succinate dehydrogenase assembly factor 1
MLSPRADLTPRAEFQKHLAVDKRDFAAIEFLLRKGRRQLDVYSAPGVKDIR